MTIPVKRPLQEDKDREQKKEEFLARKKTKKKRVLAEEHHRRPRSLGGSNHPSNISYIPPEKHTAWHVLVGNMNAIQIADFLNSSKEKPKDIEVSCSFINGSAVLKTGENNSRNPNKIAKAWNNLFHECESFEQIIAYVNNTLIDPSYHFCIFKKN